MAMDYLDFIASKVKLDRRMGFGVEAGETMQAAQDATYSDGGIHLVAHEAAQTGAMAIRVLAGMEGYKPAERYRD